MAQTSPKQLTEDTPLCQSNGKPQLPPTQASYNHSDLRATDQPPDFPLYDFSPPQVSTATGAMVLEELSEVLYSQSLFSCEYSSSDSAHQKHACTKETFPLLKHKGKKKLFQIP